MFQTVVFFIGFKIYTDRSQNFLILHALLGHLFGWLSPLMHLDPISAFTDPREISHPHVHISTHSFNFIEPIAMTAFIVRQAEFKTKLNHTFWPPQLNPNATSLKKLSCYAEILFAPNTQTKCSVSVSPFPHFILF